MARTGKRTWIKLHTHGILHGSVSYQLSDAEQSVWIKLLCLAGEVNRDGQISDNDGRPYPHHFIAHELHITKELLESTIKKCTDEGRISEDDTGLHITNWAVYQSEYQRQKQYRDKEDKKHFTYRVCHTCGHKEKSSERKCPKCAKKGIDSDFQVDYTAGTYGKHVKQ